MAIEKEKLSICRVRRDLRLNDNAALFYALKSPYPVLSVFVFDADIQNKSKNLIRNSGI